MNWVSIIWSMIASACLTLAAIHFLVWCQRRTAWSDLLFTLTSVGVAVFAGYELAMMLAKTPQQFASALRWIQVPTWIIVVSLVGFVRLYLRAGRRWLAWSVFALRSLALLLNFLVGQNLNYREVTGLRHISFLGESLAVGVGVSNPWMLVGQLSLFLWVIFTLDAAIVAWCRGDRRQAVVTGGSIVLFAIAGFTQAVLVLWNIVDLPLTASVFFLGIVLAMGYEMSREPLRAAQLSYELLESQQRIRLAANAANLSIWEWDILRDEIWVTEKGRERAGVSASERIDFARFLQVIHPEDRELTQRAMRHSLEVSGEFEAEYRVVRPDGATRWVVARGQVQRDRDGKPLRLRGVSVDITERRRSEDALRESEARFRTVANAAPVMIWMSGTDKLCNFFNRGWLDYTGRTLEQELGNGWAEGVHPDDLQGCLKTYIEAFDTRQRFTMEYRLLRRDGKYRWLSDCGVPRYDDEQNFLGYIGSCVDLTERRAADERFRLAVEASPDGIVLANEEGQIVLINALTERLFGYSRQELVGQTVEILIPERFRAVHPGLRSGFHAVPEARAMGAGWELFALRKDGTEFPVEIGLSPVKTEEGTLVLTTIVDITERKRVELELAQHRNELSHLSRVTTMSELSSSLAHELNQPLAIILTNAQAAQRLLAQEPPDVAETRDILGDIVSEDERAGEVIRRLRALLKPGQTQLSPLSLNEIIEEVLRIARSDLIARAVTTHVKLAKDAPKIMGDRIQLQQVLLNLILNASDAMAGIPPAQRHLTIATAHLDSLVRLSVSDNGCGLPSDPERIFQPFYTTKKEGLGLGLAICRSIVTVHKGRLWAEARGATVGPAGAAAAPGGTTLYLELPADQGGSDP